MHIRQPHGRGGELNGKDFRTNIKLLRAERREGVKDSTNVIYGGPEGERRGEQTNLLSEKCQNAMSVEKRE